MARQATAWKHGGQGNGQARGGAGKNTPKERDIRFGTQEQMSKGFFGTYNAVKDLIINQVQREFEYGCDSQKT
jgi:hypothetical protein